MFDVATGEFLFKIRNEHAGQISALALSSDGQFLVSGGSDEQIGVSIPETDEHLATLRGHTNRVWDVKVAPSGDTMASAGADGEVLFWDVPRDAQFHNVDGAVTVHQSSTRLTAVDYSPGGDLLAFAGHGALLVVDTETHNVQSLPVGDRQVAAVHFSSERELISVERNGIITVWDLNNSRPTVMPNPLVDDVRSLAMSPDGTRLAIAVHSGGTPSLRIFGWPECRELHHLRLEQALHFVRYSPDGRQIVLAGVGRLIMFDARSLTPRFELRETPGAYYEADYLAGGERLLVAEGHRGLTIRDAQTGQLLSQLSGHVDGVVAVAASPNGRNAASVDDGGTTCIWDLVTEQVLLQFQDIDPLTAGFCFSPTGDRLAGLRRNDNSELVVFDAATRPAIAPLRTTDDAR